MNRGVGISIAVLAVTVVAAVIGAGPSRGRTATLEAVRTPTATAAATPAAPAPPAIAPFAPAPPPQAAGGPDGRSALDGDWVERGDPSIRGEALGWPRGTFRGRPVHVPSSPTAGTVRGDAGLRSHNGSVAWYRTTFTIATAGDYALRFESINHKATAWVDGRQVARHTGVYLPFDVAMALTPGAHQLVVRADWRNPERMKATGWHRTWFNFGGINREVTIRPLGRSELDVPRLL